MFVDIAARFGGNLARQRKRADLSQEELSPVDEERSQTRAIHARQRERETLEGLLAERERSSLLALHRNAQRLLEPIAVVNPYARALRFADARTRTRRDHMKYLALIRVIALLHQHQRPRREATTESGENVPYVEVGRSDIVLANRLAHAVLGHSLDELPPGTRRLLGLIEATSRRGRPRNVRRTIRSASPAGSCARRLAGETRS